MKQKKQLFIPFMILIFVTSCNQDKKRLVPGELKNTKSLMGCHLRPAVITIQGDSNAIVCFAQSAAVFYMNLREKGSKRRIELLTKAKLNHTLICLYLWDNPDKGKKMIADVTTRIDF